MSDEPRRRQRTRYLQLGVAAVVVAIGLGAEALVRSMPEVDRREQLTVTGLPALASDDDRSCTRRDDDPTAGELRAAFPAGGRISSAQVTACPSAYDALEVTYVGEVVGELLPRRGGAWAQVNDDPYALEVGPLVGHRALAGFNSGLAVWLPDGLHERIGDVGRPARRGDVIVVRGRLLRADPDDGGGITIRADELEVLADSVEVEVPLHVPQALVAALLAVATLVAIGWRWWARRDE